MEKNHMLSFSDNCSCFFLFFLRFWKFKVMTCEVERLHGCSALDGPGQDSFRQSVDKMQELESCRTA